MVVTTLKWLGEALRAVGVDEAKAVGADGVWAHIGSL